MQLNEQQVRVLASLVEKEAVTPDNYPMSLNGLMNACNQLTSRDPVMQISETEVQAALDTLMQEKLVAQVNQAGARVMKYEHRMRLHWLLEQDKLAVLSLLMLRGWQTAGEIRSSSGRLHEFASVVEVEKALDYLADKYPPLVMKLPLTPGTKEPRYAHLLAYDEQAVLAQLGSQPDAVVGSRRLVSGDRLQELELEVAGLKQQYQELAAQFAEFKRQFE